MANKFLTLTSTNGVPTATQPAFTDLSGSASLTTQVSGILPIANGGTDNGSLAVTAGGILYTDGTKFQNAGAGSSGQVLQSNGSSAPTWVAASTAAAATVTSQSSTYSVPATNYIVLCSGASFTVTLPTAVGASGGMITIKHAGTSLTDVYTIATTSSQTIGGIAGGSYALYTNQESLVVVSDGSNWQILDHFTITPWVNFGTSYITSTNAYTFTIPSSSITIGTIYTNNGQTFTVSATTASSTTLTCAGTGSPTASGTLTFVSGSPSGNLSFSASTTTGAPAKGTVTNDKVWWRRVGQHAEIRYEFQAASGTSGTGDYLIEFPTNLSPDTTVLTAFLTANVGSSTTPRPTNAFGTTFCSSTATDSPGATGMVSVWNSSFFRIVHVQAGSGVGQSECWNAGTMGLGNTSATMNTYFSMPIAGWQP